MKNPNYWRKDKNGKQLPVPRQDHVQAGRRGRQQRLNALQAGEFDMIAHDSARSTSCRSATLAKNGTLADIESDKFAEVGYTMFNATEGRRSTT